MDTLKNLIQRCQQRHENSLRQRRTVVTPALYNKSYPYHFKVYCAHRYPILLADLERSHISFMPIGQSPENDIGPRTLGGERFLKRQGTQDWGMRRWHASWGIQIYTGIPSELNGANWHDFNFSYQALHDSPKDVLTCIESLIETVPNPLLTMTKSGGLRFSFRLPEYLHPNTLEAKYYIYKESQTPENSVQSDVYLKISGFEGYSRWDARYEILLGNVLDPPVIAKEVVFAPIDALRVVLHTPQPEHLAQEKINTETPYSLGSRNLNLAKYAFLNRGFSYLRQENGVHYWLPPRTEIDDRFVLLWEDEDVVWVRSSVPDIGLPTMSTLITDIWDDTGILSLSSHVGTLVPDRVDKVQEGELSPLAIKRPTPVLNKSDERVEEYDTGEKNGVQTNNTLNQSDRILGLIADESPEKHYKAVSHIRDGGITCLNVPTYKLAEKLENHYQNRNLPQSKR